MCSLYVTPTYKSQITDYYIMNHYNNELTTEPYTNNWNSHKLLYQSYITIL